MIIHPPSPLRCYCSPCHVLQRARSHPVPLPVPLPVSGRTLGRHVSLGPGWEMNREEQLLPPQHDYDQPSTSQAMLSPEAS